MSALKKKQAHLWERDAADWYVEPRECSLALFDMEKFEGPVWDPACGLGRIVESAQFYGLSAYGTDVAVRSRFCKRALDFLSYGPTEPVTNIVSNPPFAHAEEFVLKSLSLLTPGGKVAFLLPLVWMAGFSNKRHWLPKSPLLKIFSISPRPSMPPGAVIEAGAKPGNGTKDFAWFIWQSGYRGSANLEFMNTNGYKNLPIQAAIA